METATVPCEMLSQSDSVTVILRPAITQSSWSDVEAFGANVRTELEKRTTPACLIDLSPLTYMGSGIVALIVRVWKVVQSKGGKMVVLCPNPAVLEVIKLAGLDKIWTIAAEPDAAAKKLGLRHSATTPVRNTTLEASGASATPAKSGVWYIALGVVLTLLVLMGCLLYLGNR